MAFSLRRPAIELLLTSAAALLLELALIRWIPEHVRVIAYFPNLVLIATFLGLGVGALGKFKTASWVAPLTFFMVAVGLLMSRVAFTAEGVSEHLWLLYLDLPKDAPVINSVVLPITAVFMVAAVLFIPLGGVIAGRIQAFKTQEKTLDGYAFDLVGSLLGVVAFLGLAAVGSRPIWWFVCPLVAAALSLPRSWITRVIYFIFVGGVLVLIVRSDRAEVYSPYYAISTTPGANGSLLIMTNGSLHQQALDLRVGAHLRSDMEVTRQGYRLPVDLLSAPPRRVLVLGAGSGNDVTALLDAGVPEIHAVEIDPAIIEIGRSRHPAHPYQDPRVIIHNSDARAFLEHTDLRFDLIIFGTLDSMTRLSALSNVRLDNFVYTLESLQAARARLTDRGGIALMFMAANPAIQDHLFNLFWNAFGEPPAVVNHHYVLFNSIHFGGPGYAQLKNDPNFVDTLRTGAGKRSNIPRDDWPYLYLQGPGISFFYLEIGGIVLLVAALLLFGVSRQLRQSLINRQIDYEMLILGAAFLLCETGFVTRMNLLFGATWQTSSVIFGSILVALVIATLIARRFRVHVLGSLLATAAALVAVAFLPLREIAPDGLVLRILFTIAVCGLPLTGAGLVFAARFRLRAEADVAFGWNVLGAVLGGLLEMSSMLLGLRAMFIGAALLYAVVGWLIYRHSQASGTNQGVSLSPQL